VHPFGLSRSERKAVRNNWYTNELDRKKVGGSHISSEHKHDHQPVLIAIALRLQPVAAALSARIAAAKKLSVNDERRVNQGAKLETNGHGHLPTPLAAS
jgi:hypothetical protein